MIETAKPTIAVTATFTAELIEEPLTYWMQELGIQSGIEFAPYNQVFQQLLDPSSLLSGNEEGINVVLVRLEDWQKYKSDLNANIDFLSGECEQIDRNVQELIQALKSAAKRSATPYIVCMCPGSPVVMENARRLAFFEQMEELMASELDDASGVYLITTSKLRSSYPVSQYNDPFTDEIGRIPYTPAFFTSLATMIARRIFAMRSAPYKVVVLDCDQTLWRGVCGEDGPDAVEIDAPYRALQEFMIARHDAGMLLCLCSRNNEEDIAAVFDRHPRMLLRRGHIVSWRINWRNKSENIKSLADELQLGLDSFIFIDDDPIECAEVQAECPEVVTLRLPQQPDDIPRFLDHVWAFDRLNITKEDKNRAESYRQNAERSRFQKENPTFRDFLAGLELKVDISKMSHSQISRVAQLTQRTNQFNSTTIRRSEAEIEKLCRSEELECLVVEVSDRFGDYGLVGVMMFSAGAETLEVDTFLLSCRALGRGVEHQMLAKLGETAKEHELAHISIPCTPTKKNQPGLNFLNGLDAGIEKRSEDHLIFTLSAEDAASLTCDSTISREYAPETGKIESVGASIGQKVWSISRLFERITTELYDVEHILKDIESKRQDSIRSTPKRGYVAPRTPTEQMLTEVWIQVLHVDQTGIHDNFFKVGGQSLLGTVFLSRVQSTFQVELSLLSIFESPTIAELAQLIEQHLINQLDPKELPETLRELNGLSDEEVKELLALESTQLTKNNKVSP